MDCLFLHVPAIRNGSEKYLQMPLGMPALAWYLDNEGNISSKIFNKTIEDIADKNFNVNRLIQTEEVNIVCMDLHWRGCARNVLDTAKEIKDCNDDCKIILGGYTASFFSREIIQKHSEVDYVINGDAEVPLLQLIERLLSHKGRTAFQDIPNLTWRNGKSVVQNELSYIGNKKMMNELEYTHLQYINNWELYVRNWTFEYEIRQVSKEDILKGESLVFYNPGRGCGVNCTFCGGSKQSQRIISHRNTTVVKSHKSVLRDFAILEDYCIERIHICFESFADEAYYVDLFDLMRSNKMMFNMTYECYGLPTYKFLKAFRKTFGHGSIVILSPDSGSEKIRKLNKGIYYSNKRLMKSLDYLQQLQIPAQLFFTLGMPFESETDFKETEDLIAIIEEKYDDSVMCVISPLEIDPGSPMWLDEKKYHIHRNSRTLDDYAYGDRTSLLDYSSDHFSEERILECFKRIVDKYY